jgi:hypothetical protein
VACKAKGLLSETLVPYTDVRPLYFYRSCILPPVDLPIAVRLSSDSYMHVTHLANYWSSNPLSVTTKDVANITELPVGLFGSMAPALVAWVGAPVTPGVDPMTPMVDPVPNPESTVVDDWKCVYRQFVHPDNREDDYDVNDYRLPLLPGCKIKDQKTGYILADIANILYSPWCVDWDDFDAKKFVQQEKDLPAQVCT